MRTGTPELDDAAALLAADVDGLLPTAALAGAQVRSVAEAVREGVLEPLAELRPRSVVIVHGAGVVPARAASLVVTALASRIDVPIVCVPQLPGWIGPLDVVMIVGEDAGDMALADAAARAGRRRAEVVVAAPIAGPLQDALGGNGIDLSPRVDVEPRFRFIGFVAALLAMLTALTSVRFTGTAPRLDELADALDAEAASGHPDRETFHNRAKSLALRIAGRETVWTGDSPGAVVLATQACSSLLAVAGTVAAAADLGDVGRFAGVRAQDRSAPAAIDPIFHDPEIDGPLTQPARVFVVSTAAREWFTRHRVTGLGDTDLLLGDDEADTAGTTPSGRPAGVDAITDGPADLTGLLVLALRVELAAVYLRLVGDAPR